MTGGLVRLSRNQFVSRMNVGLIILALKAAVIAVTVLLGISIWALSRGRYRLHGRLNIAFFALTLSALIGLELIVRLLIPESFEAYLDQHGARAMLRVHLWFSIPA